MGYTLRPAITMLTLFLIPALVGVAYAGIEIPRDNCRWLTAPDWNTVLKCDGNEVVVGACSGGGGWGHKVEGSCHSGESHDCYGAANQIDCCAGHLAGQKVGPTDQCGWQYSGHGVQLDCGRSDEVVVGRCGSGGNLDCPGSTSHGNLCCELDVLPQF